LLLILSDIVGLETDLNIIQDVKIQNQLKIELIAMRDKNSITDHKSSVKNFDEKYLVKKVHDAHICDLQDVFNPDLANSIFNHISIEEASARGEVFFKEYLIFNGLEDTVEHKSIQSITSNKYQFPEIIFEG
jgi:hypothetical protein